MYRDKESASSILVLTEIEKKLNEIGIEIISIDSMLSGQIQLTVCFAQPQECTAQ
jgi:hypothetical protein